MARLACRPLSTSKRIHALAMAAAMAAGFFATVLPLAAQTVPSRTPAARVPAARVVTPRATAGHSTTPAHPTTPATPTAPLAKAHPLLPAAVAVEAFFADLSLSPKIPGIVPAGFEPLSTAAEWQTYRDKYGVEADNLTKQKPSGQVAFAEKLIAETQVQPEGVSLPAGVRRLMLIRAAAIAYRTKDGYPTANKAVTAYLTLMDKKSPAQVGALWSISNIMARTAVTPKPERIRYDGIAAKANMQLALLMLDVDQIEAAQTIIRQVTYHEGWLKSDPATRTLIAQVRADVKQTNAMMEYLESQYQPAIHNDVNALTMVYLYGRYVKGNLAIVADLPGRVPESHLAQLAASLDAASRGDMTATFTAAENLRLMAASVTDGRIKARTLYAAMQLYDSFMASPATERDRVQRTLARIAREGVVSDGARKGLTIDVFAPPPAPATAPPETLQPVHPEVRPDVRPGGGNSPVRVALGGGSSGE